MEIICKDEKANQGQKFEERKQSGEKRVRQSRETDMATPEES